MTDERPSRKAAKRMLWSMLVAAAILVLSPTAVSAQSEDDDPALLEAGEEVFSTSCVGCHGADGTGSDTGRPLIGIAGQEPDRSVHIASVTMGKGGMPAFESSLSAEQIEAAVTYVRLTFVSDTSAMQELPNTGNEPVLLLVAAGLIAFGLALTVAAQRHPA